MTLDQGWAFAILAGTIVLFVWDRLRYDFVAMLALAAGLATGVIPADNAFHGFSDPVVVIVAAALVVSAAIERSGVIELLVRPLARIGSRDLLIGTLVVAVGSLSAFMKNIGALAIFMPLSLRLARPKDLAPSQVLMPLSFAALIGGLATLIGTSPNILISRVRLELTGQPFHMFDFAPVGVGIAVCGILFLTFGWRLLPIRHGKSDQFHVEDYLAEVRVLPGSPLAGATVADFEQLFSGGALSIVAIRVLGRSYVPAPHWEFSVDDVLVLEGNTKALTPLLEGGRLMRIGEPNPSQTDLAISEVVVMPTSPLVGCLAASSPLRREGLAVLAISRGDRQLVERVPQMVFKAGDVLVLQGAEETMTATLGQMGCLPLAQRQMPTAKRSAPISLGILAVAMVLVATSVVKVAPAFFLAAVAMILTRQISLKEAYDAINWQIIVLLGGLIPVADAMTNSGASDLMAGWLAQAAARLPHPLAVSLVLVSSMLLAPFLHHAATVLLMGPIAAAMALRLGLAVDPFLMAVAVGAASDFLTPIGHQCNTLILGPGGYRFGDYWRLGLPLSVIVVTVGTLLILVVWPIYG